jgi:hypothetical protein
MSVDIILCLATAAGIPDFRSPGTGLYDNLQKYSLPNPQAIFEIGYFRQNPQPFFHLAKELYPAKFKVQCSIRQLVVVYHNVKSETLQCPCVSVCARVCECVSVCVCVCGYIKNVSVHCF